MKWANFVEKYLIGAFFLYFAYRALPITTAASLLIAAFFFFSGVMLLTSPAPIRDPRYIDEVVVPIAGTFFYLLWPLTDHAPAFMRVRLFTPLPVVALFVSGAGYVMALWALAYLGRSFSVVVAVRRLVTAGPYKYCRHPMYGAYVLQFAGIFIADPTLARGAFLACHIGILCYRAILEEVAILDVHPDYRHQLDRAGFFFPRWIGVAG